MLYGVAIRDPLNSIEHLFYYVAVNTSTYSNILHNTLLKNYQCPKLDNDSLLSLSSSSTKGVNSTNLIPQLYISVVWCGAFGGDRKDFNYQKSKEIKDIIIRTGEWEQVKYSIRFGDIYGNQRGFKRKNDYS